MGLEETLGHYAGVKGKQERINVENNDFNQEEFDGIMECANSFLDRGAVGWPLAFSQYNITPAMIDMFILKLQNFLEENKSWGKKLGYFVTRMIKRSYECGHSSFIIPNAP